MPQEVKALVDVTTKIDAGEVVVVCGPSGSGKSTYLRCLNRLEKADSGHIFIDGVDVLNTKTNINKVRAEVGMVFQSFNLFPHKTVFENITLAQKVVRKRSKADAKEKADFLLQKAGVAVVPGSAFGAEGYIRLSFATSMEQLEESIIRIAKALA